MLVLLQLLQRSHRHLFLLNHGLVLDNDVIMSLLILRSRYLLHVLDGMDGFDYIIIVIEALSEVLDALLFLL